MLSGLEALPNLSSLKGDFLAFVELAVAFVHCPVDALQGLVHQLNHPVVRFIRVTQCLCTAFRSSSLRCKIMTGQVHAKVVMEGGGLLIRLTGNLSKFASTLARSSFKASLKLRNVLKYCTQSWIRCTAAKTLAGLQ